jgi:hypothetical protein
MNWLGLDLVALLASLFGAFVGAVVQFEAARRGVHVTPVVGAFAGLFAALASRERSGLRAMLVASFSAWAAAIAEVLAEPRSGPLADLVRFGDRMTPGSWLSFLACIVFAGALASRAWSPFSASAKSTS